MNNHKVMTYSANKTISFRKTTEQYGFLSNMINGYPLTINNIIIPSSEHLYQAMRYPLFPEIQEKIISQNNAMKAKFISNNYKDSLCRQDWDVIKIKMMYWINHLKFKCHPELANLLIDTKDSFIVEYSKEDSFWGAEKIDYNYVGINMLGRILMKIREELKIKDNKLVIPDISGLLLYNQFITTGE